jgi:hypothetical protein
MTTKISEANIQPTTLESIGTGPKIVSVTVTNSSYVATGSTTVPLSGGYIKITGAAFISGAQVIFDDKLASAVVYISSTQLNVQTPVLPAESYFVYVVNPDGGTGLSVNAVTAA